MATKLEVKHVVRGPLEVLRGMGLIGISAVPTLAASLVCLIEGSLGEGLGFACMAALMVVDSLRRSAQRRDRGTRVRTVIEFQDEYFVVDDKRYARTAISRAYQLATDPPRIRIWLSRRVLPLDLELENVAQVDELLGQLGFGVSERAVAFSGQPGTGSVIEFVIPIVAMAGGGAAAGAFFMSSIAVGMMVGGGLALAILLFVFRNARVLVGRDGVLAKRGFFRTRFVPFDRIRKVTLRAEESYADAILEVEHERDLRIRFKALAEAEAFATRIRAAAEAGSSDAAPVGHELERGEMEPQTWVQRLRALADLGTSRSGGVTLERLFAVLENPKAEPARRAAAAVAISPRADEPAVRIRIEAAYESSASSELCHVLEAVREGRDDALVEALVAIEQERA